MRGDEPGDPIRGCLFAFLLVGPAWILLGLGVYWLGHR